MEYLAGGTLAARMREGALAQSDACFVVRRLATVLERLHEAGLYHGDIKPSNIGFQADGVPKLLDFGLARAASGADAPLGGTYAYLSPEVRAGAPADRQLDLWALSVVLCEALLGRHPFPLARSDKQMAAEIGAALSTLRPAVSPALADVLTRALSMDVGGRPRSASELGDMLDRA
jgi:serine/threonine-protein kinase